MPFRPDAQLYPLLRDAQFLQRHPRRAIELPRFQGIHHRISVQPRGIHRHPPPPRVGQAWPEVPPEMVGVVHRNPVDGPARSQDRIPYLLAAWPTPAPVVVHHRVPVEYLQQIGPRDPHYVPVVVSPRVVRMVQRDDAPRRPYRIYIGLQRGRRFARVHRLHVPPDPDGPKVHRCLALVQLHRHLFPGDHQRPLPPFHPVLQDSNVVMVRKHQEIVPVPPVPPHRLFRFGVPVGAVGVGVDVALEPHRPSCGSPWP